MAAQVYREERSLLPIQTDALFVLMDAGRPRRTAPSRSTLAAILSALARALVASASGDETRELERVSLRPLP